ncbi:hypothetical protein Halhy_4696 [Haliscomenobacter hydrossis DSM 1100]|uniref:Uncharacterized protein n=1 Tax=Haliscomenobacter hydrossis (strain ATCC 27775 / DSM 1100 / LMG 10767 / O) TaxID=760192 RepID=F4KWP7_HALH1|nr:hypothetical protein Halhy_4696 [Haliscomenobacter hydrossis DSM 1100]
MGTRMTRIERIFTDFRLRRKFFCHKLHKFSQIEAQTSFALTSANTNEVSVQFVKICAICGQFIMPQAG